MRRLAARRCGGRGASVALDYHLTPPERLGKFDVIFDTVGTQMSDFRRHLAPGGRMVSITATPLLRGLATIVASAIHGNRRIRLFSGKPTPALLNDYAQYIDWEQIRALIDSTYSLEELAAAHRDFAGGGRGKRVIVI